jgi:glycosyltransferase involved in cell wall biosynthesis
MPIYNGVEYLRESLSSIILQTYEDWELLIGINGYPAKSKIWRKINDYNSNKIKVFDLYMCNSKSQTLNELIKLTVNDWVCLLDVDDIWEPEKLETQLKYIEKYQVIGTNAIYFGDKNNDPKIPLNEIDIDVFKYVNPIINSSAMFLREDAHWLEIKGVEDYDMWCRIAVKGRKFFNVPKILVNHRIHKNSAFNNLSYNESILKIREKYFSGKCRI